MFDYTDPQKAEALAWACFLAFLIVAAGVGSLLHGINREWRQYLKYRRTHARWRQIVEGGGK